MPRASFDPSHLRSRLRDAFRGALALALMMILGLLASPPDLRANPGLAGNAPDLPGPRWFASPSARRPPFFKVGGGPGAQVYLLGTIHLGPEEGWTYPRRIRRALGGADTLVMEIDLRLADEETLSQTMIQHVLLPDGQRLSKTLSPETLELITKYDDDFRAAGLPFLAREGLRPWYLATSLTELATSRSGLSMAHSADGQIMAALGAREFIALESIEEQFGFFDDLSLPLQDVMLRDTLSRWDEAVDSLGALTQAWQQGDEPELIAFAREGLDTAPELAPFFDILLDQRNARWAEKLTTMLNDPARDGTDVFVAVGAFHLVGPNSVPALLEEAGFKVKKE